MINQERLDAARELMASLGCDTQDHVQPCYCHRCACWDALHSWIGCETATKPCMCLTIAAAIVHQHALAGQTADECGF